MKKKTTVYSNEKETNKCDSVWSQTLVTLTESTFYNEIYFEKRKKKLLCVIYWTLKEIEINLKCAKRFTFYFIYRQNKNWLSAEYDDYGIYCTMYALTTYTESCYWCCDRSVLTQTHSFKKCFFCFSSTILRWFAVVTMIKHCANSILTIITEFHLCGYCYWLCQ